jgi:hypothetical protein
MRGLLDVPTSERADHVVSWMMLIRAHVEDSPIRESRRASHHIALGVVGVS